MNAEWNVNEIAKMGEEQNLRNLCRQLECQYVDWNRDATYDGYRVCVEWPQIGELGRYLVAGVQVRLITTYKRTIEVQRPDGTVVDTFAMVPGLARELYLCAGSLLDLSDHCESDGSPCICELCVSRRQDAIPCIHVRLNEEGICRSCGTDRRGI